MSENQQKVVVGDEEQPLSPVLSGRSSKRNIETFLTGLNNSVVEPEDSNHIGSPLERMENLSDLTNIPKEMNSLESPVKEDGQCVQHVDEPPSDQIKVNISAGNLIDFMDADEIVATPKIIIKASTKCLDSSKDLECHKNNPEEMDRFMKMSAVIQQKDEEIRKLSDRLIELENRSKTVKLSHHSSSSDKNSSSDDKKTKKKSDKSAKKKKSKSKESQSKSSEKTEKLVKPSLTATATTDKVLELEFSNIVENFEEGNIPANDKSVVDLKLKIDTLSDEVRKLQQANVDSILTLQSIRDTNSTNLQQNKSKSAADESLIKQLIIDHNLLKEELDQLKWEHSKLSSSQPKHLVEEIRLLKKDINHLRKQNNLLKVVAREASLTRTSRSEDWKKHAEGFNNYYDSRTGPTRINTSSDYIYDRLQSKSGKGSATPNVQTMLKKSIESLESPYHATCQTIHKYAPFAGGETYRNRRSSESSSNLAEDASPKNWIENPHLYKPAVIQYSNNHRESSNHRIVDVDQCSEDSFVTITTSIHDREDDFEDIFKYNKHRSYKDYEIDDKNKALDLLSTADTESIIDDLKDTSYKANRNPQLGYAFTPKIPSDLNLEDIVKFARPGGKMSSGRVCFIGHLPGRNEICVGIELDEDAGKHDGTFENVRYFQCRKNRGVFISFHKIILAYKSM